MAEKSRHTATSSDAKRSTLENLLKEAKSCSSKIESLEAQASDLEQLRREHLQNWFNELAKVSTPKLVIQRDTQNDPYLITDLNFPDFLTVSNETEWVYIHSKLTKELSVNGVLLRLCSDSTFRTLHNNYLQCKGCSVEANFLSNISTSFEVLSGFHAPSVTINFSEKQLLELVIDFLEEQNARISYSDDSSVSFDLSKKLEPYAPKAIIKRLLKLMEQHPEKSHFEVSSTETTYTLDMDEGYENTLPVHAYISTQDDNFYLGWIHVPNKVYNLVRKSKLDGGDFEEVYLEEFDSSKLPTIEDFKQALRDKMESSEKS